MTKKHFHGFPYVLNADQLEFIETLEDGTVSLWPSVEEPMLKVWATIEECLKEGIKC